MLPLENMLKTLNLSGFKQQLEMTPAENNRHFIIV